MTSGSNREKVNDDEVSPFREGRKIYGIFREVPLPDGAAATKYSRTRISGITLGPGKLSGHMVYMGKNVKKKHLQKWLPHIW